SIPAPVSSMSYTLSLHERSSDLSLLFKVIAKTPVPEHLEHRMVIGIFTYFFQVIVLTANAQTLLSIRNSCSIGSFIPQEILFELDRKSTRLNSSHVKISYAVFCL